MRVLLILIFLVQIIVCKAGVFDTLKALPAAQRIIQAQSIYDNKIKGHDSVFAIHELEQLSVIARDIHDPSLNCFSVSLLADHYARIRQLNDYSTELHLQAIRMAEDEKLLLMTAICTYRTGRYFYSFKNYPLAFEYLLRADNYFREIGYDEVPNMDGILYVLGGIYYETGNYERAAEFMQEIQSLPHVDHFVKKQSLNTLALIAKQSGDTAKALAYFQQTLNLAIPQKDSIWMGVCFSNIGSLYFSMKQFDKAYSFLQRGFDLSMHYKQWNDAYADMLLLSRIELVRGNLPIASQKINTALAIEGRSFSHHNRKYLLEAQLAYYKKAEKDKLALGIQDALMLLKDSIALNKNQKAYREIQLRIETEKHLNAITKLEEQARTRTFRRNAAILGLVLLILVLLLLYRYNRMQARNAAAILQADKLRAEEKLKYARQLLQNFTENTRQKNELIDRFAAELEKLKAGMPGHPSYEERKRVFDQQFRSGILTEEGWNAFGELFEKVHKDFFAALATKYPSLSLTETRLLALVRLDLNEAEIGNMIGMDKHTIQMLLELLRKKMGGDRTLEALVRAI